ncbi:MAG: DUF72 domain-containing protein [Stellaceae bacterium]
MAGTIRIGIGGWTYERWRGLFYPAGLPQKQELTFAAGKLTSIEINGTYYSTFKSNSWAKWRDETPSGFVFAVKALRYCTNRRVLAEAGDSVKRFLDQGLTELGDRLGPINWQFMASKKFDPVDFEAFLKLLPSELGGRPLRHALELRSPTFKNEQFYDLARRYKVAVCFADDDEFPVLDETTTDFTYARLMRSKDEIETGYGARDLDSWAKKAKEWAKRGDAFVYFISGDKHRNPAAAMALIERTKK